MTTDFIVGFKTLYKKTLTLRALVFVLLTGAVLFFLYGKSLFHEDGFNISYGEYQYVSIKEGKRSSPSIYYIQGDGIGLVGVQDLSVSCMYRLNLNKHFKVGVVKLYEHNMIVFCSQDKIYLNAKDGLQRVKDKLNAEKFLAFLGLAIAILFIGVVLSFYWAKKS